jgi:hypothetical protein
MSVNLTNTPVLAVKKSKDEAEKEMKETTKKEMEKLANILKNRQVSMENKFVEEEFLDTSSEEINTEDELSESSTSSSTKNLLTAISGIANKHKTNKSNKKHKKEKYNLVENAVKVEKLKHEIEKLETKLKYSILDMNNLNIEISNLNKFKDKFEIVEKIMKNFESKELYLYEKDNELKTIMNFKEYGYKRGKLTELMSVHMTPESKLDNYMTDKIEVKDILKTVNMPILSKLVNDKNHSLDYLYDQYNHRIYKNLQLIDDERNINAVIFIFLFLSSILSASVYYYFYYRVK